MIFYCSKLYTQDKRDFFIGFSHTCPVNNLVLALIKYLPLVHSFKICESIHTLIISSKFFVLSEQQHMNFVFIIFNLFSYIIVTTFIQHDG